MSCGCVLRQINLALLAVFSLPLHPPAPTSAYEAAPLLTSRSTKRYALRYIEQELPASSTGSVAALHSHGHDAAARDRAGQTQVARYADGGRAIGDCDVLRLQWGAGGGQMLVTCKKKPTVMIKEPARIHW